MRCRLALAILIVWVVGAAPAPRAEPRVTTPSGARVELEHVIRPGGVTTDYWQYVDPDGEEVLHGIFQRYYRNGERRELTTYEHGVKHGRFAKWRDHEVLEVEGRYNRGKLEGLITWYYPSGKKRNEEFYRDGELNGPFAWFFESGQVQERGTYEAGERHGPYSEYYENGQLYIQATYEHGYLTGEIAIYDEAGRLQARGALERDMIAGTWFCYSPPGGEPRPRRDCRGKIYVECTCD